MTSSILSYLNSVPFIFDVPTVQNDIIITNSGCQLVKKKLHNLYTVLDQYTQYYSKNPQITAILD